MDRIAVNSFWGAGATNCNRTTWLYYCIEQ